MKAYILPLLALASAPAAAFERHAPAAEPAAGGLHSGERGRPVTGLRFARDRTFYSLDEYLAFLHKGREFDTPWYRPVGRNEYEEVTRRVPGTRPKRVTREELMRKYGFTR